MKTTPVAAVLCVCLTAATAISTMPAIAHGEEIFVVNSTNGWLGEYDAANGAAINASLITGLEFPASIAVSGDDLFVANEFTGTIGEYTTSGTPVNATLVSGLGLGNYYTVAVSGADLFVTNLVAGTVGEYDAATGATINASLITPGGNTFAIAESAGNLFVVYGAGNDPTTIGEYTTSGAVVNASLVTGLDNPYHIAVSGGQLFVSSSETGTIGEYDATTGATINASLIPALGSNAVGGIAVSGENLFVSSGGGMQGAGTISEYTTGGMLVNASLVTGLWSPTGIVVVPEPGTWKMSVIGATAMLVCGLRRRRPLDASTC